MPGKAMEAAACQYPFQKQPGKAARFFQNGTKKANRRKNS
jgi:hypothetical protein